MPRAWAIVMVPPPSPCAGLPCHPSGASAEQPPRSPAGTWLRSPAHPSPLRTASAIHKRSSAAWGQRDLVRPPLLWSLVGRCAPVPVVHACGDSASACRLRGGRCRGTSDTPAAASSARGSPRLNQARSTSHAHALSRQQGLPTHKGWPPYLSGLAALSGLATSWNHLSHGSPCSAWPAQA